MRRRLILAAVLSLLALPLQAGPAEDSIIRQLRDQGFAGIEVNRTLLGRLRITAQSRKLEREIILNPATGEILRDYWEERGGSPLRGAIINPAPGGTGSHGDDDDKDRDDDDGDDDGRDDGRADNSGRGNASDRGDDDGGRSGSGGNSGSGSGGDSDGDD